ncbi:metal-dependent transcriptional regulator [Nonlabens sp.]|jgi:DtxR family Mn-dependent transcriptional regulator|uniref:metal-dependent transcriptional regulator n=1 Tax=Nonlabens sp. TaxID=1888209 RepID=UPI001BCE7E2E|nr:metal-dependent transcriptional regulator [Nonlabens sp.]
MHSISEENYIKAIYHLQEGQALVSTNDIAGRMKTKASSVTDMLKKLADKKLAEYIPYKGARLTENGVLCANQIIRKHRLWEVFLVEKLDFSWDEVHDVAEQLEHIQSPKLTNELDKFLNYPKHDPHGDPIPDSKGNYEKYTQVALGDLEIGQQGVLTGVVNTSRDFLRYLDKHEIKLGAQIQLLEIEEFDGSCRVKSDGRELYISKQTVESLFVKIK